MENIKEANKNIISWKRNYRIKGKLYILISFMTGFSAFWTRGPTFSFALNFASYVDDSAQSSIKFDFVKC